MSGRDTPSATVRMKAIDVKPNRWALLCTFDGSDRVVENPICLRRWSEDGESIWFMLDSHNFYNAKPDDEMEVVPHRDTGITDEFMAESDARDAERMSQKPPLRCAACGAVASTS